MSDKLICVRRVFVRPVLPDGSPDPDEDPFYAVLASDEFVSVVSPDVCDTTEELESLVRKKGDLLRVVDPHKIHFVDSGRVGTENFCGTPGPADEEEE